MLTASVAEKLFGPDYSIAVRSINSFCGRLVVKTMSLQQFSRCFLSNSHFDFQVAISSGRIIIWGSRIYVQTNEKSDFKEVWKFNLNKTISSPLTHGFAKEEVGMPGTTFHQFQDYSPQLAYIC